MALRHRHEPLGHGRPVRGARDLTRRRRTRTAKVPPLPPSTTHTHTHTRARTAPREVRSLAQGGPSSPQEEPPSPRGSLVDARREAAAWHLRPPIVAPSPTPPPFDNRRRASAGGASRRRRSRRSRRGGTCGAEADGARLQVRRGRLRGHLLRRDVAPALRRDFFVPRASWCHTSRRVQSTA